MLTCSLPLVFLVSFLVLFCVSCPFLSIMSRKTRANRTFTSSPSPIFDSDRFLSGKNQEAFKKFNLRRNIWAERKVLLDELDPEIRRNFKRRGWLSLLDISHPPPATLIREFYLNLYVHSYDANTLVRSWVRGVGYTIILSVVADAFGVPVVQHPVYPYDEFPSLDDIMSYIIGSSIQWGSDPWITTTKLTVIHYLFFRIACHSIWPISHLHTIPLERCAFLYALVTDALISFPHLFIHSLIKVHRSCSIAHALFFPVFIHRIFLHLGLVEFPVSEPVHTVAPISATFLRQRAAHLRASSKRLKVEPSGVAPPPPSFTGDTTAEEPVDHVADVPPPSTLNDSDI